MKTKDIDELRWIVRNDLQILVRVTFPEFLAIACFIAAVATLETPAVSWTCIAVTMLFVERHVAWCFGADRHKYNRHHHGH